MVVILKNALSSPFFFTSYSVPSKLTDLFFETLAWHFVGFFFLLFFFGWVTPLSQLFLNDSFNLLF